MVAARQTAYILRTDSRVDPFGDPAWTSRVWDVPLVTVQRRILERFGFTVREIGTLAGITGPGLLVTDDLFFSPQLLRKFLSAIKGRSGTVGIGVTPGVFTMRTTVLGGPCPIPFEGREILPYPLLRVDGPLENMDDVPRVEVTLWEKVVYPKGIDTFRPDGMDIRQGLTVELIMRLDNWVNILYANFFGIGAWWLDPSPGRILWAIWRALTALSLNPWKIARRLNVIGRGCDVHPSSTLEGCVLGHGVTVGPYCHLQGVFLGDGVKVEGNNRVAFSVIGARSTLASMAQVNMSVMYPDSLVSTPGIQLCVVGQGTLLLALSAYLDLKYRREIVVTYKGRRVSLGTNNIGSCIGHRTIIAAKVMIDAGMSIPNDVVIVPSGTDILARFPKEYPLHHPLVVGNRTCEPLVFRKE